MDTKHKCKNLKNEYIIFSENITELISCITLPTKLHSNETETSENMLGMDLEDESSVEDIKRWTNCIGNNASSF